MYGNKIFVLSGDENGREFCIMFFTSYANSKKVLKKMNTCCFMCFFYLNMFYYIISEYIFLFLKYLFQG